MSQTLARGIEDSMWPKPVEEPAPAPKPFTVTHTVTVQVEVDPGIMSMEDVARSIANRLASETVIARTAIDGLRYDYFAYRVTRTHPWGGGE